jgi:hypothetical protein
MTLVRPPTLREYLDSGCDLEAIPDLESYARAIIGAQTMPWQFRARLALAYDDAAEAWLAGEDAAPFGDDGPTRGTPALVQHYKWLAEGLIDNDLVEDFANALPKDLQTECMRMLDEIEAKRDADIDQRIADELHDLDEQ